MFSAHCLPSSICDTSIEGCGHVDTGGEDRAEIRFSHRQQGHDVCLACKIRTVSDPNRRVLQAQASKSKSRYSSGLTDTTLTLPAIFSLGFGHDPLLGVLYLPNTSSQVDLLHQGELADEIGSLVIGTRPISSA